MGDGTAKNPRRREVIGEVDTLRQCFLGSMFAVSGSVVSVGLHACCLQTYLSRASCEAVLQHSQLDDITGVPDDCDDGDRIAAPDITEEALSAVKKERTRHPKPSLQKRNHMSRNKSEKISV